MTDLPFEWRKPTGGGSGERLFVGKHRIGSYIFDKLTPKHVTEKDKKPWRAYLLLPGSPISLGRYVVPGFAKEAVESAAQKWFAESGVGRRVLDELKGTLYFMELIARQTGSLSPGTALQMERMRDVIAELEAVDASE